MVHKNNGAKVITGLLALLILLSSLAFLPGPNAVATSTSNQISFNVVDGDGKPVVGVQATLREVHTLKKYTNVSDSSGLVTFNPLPGYYELTIVKSGYFDYVYPQIIRFDGMSPLALNLVALEELPSKDYTLTVSVFKNGTAIAVNGVRLKVLDIENNMQEIYNSTSADGSFVVPVYPSTYKLIVSCSGYATNVTLVEITGNETMTIYMDTSTIFRGYAYLNGMPVTQGLTACLISTSTSLDIEKRIVRPKTLGTNYFEFDAYTGEFYLIVDAANAKANMTKVVLSATKTMMVNLTSQSVQTTSLSLEFYENDWNHFNLTTNLTMDFDATIPSLPYSYLKSLRMQIDFALGDGDGEINTTELQAFLQKITSFGPQNVTSEWLMKVNGTKFVSQIEGFSSLEYFGLLGPTNSTQQYSALLKTRYDSVSAISLGTQSYTGQLYASYDTQTLDYVYHISLPDGYELTANTTSSSYVKVYGYLDLTIQPQLYASTSLASVTMTFQKSVAPKAVASLVTGTNVYDVRDANSTLLYYIVAFDTEVSFSAAGSYDPNGNPLKYVWDFGDGNVAEVTTVTTKHNYTLAIYELTVSLTVVDVAGLKDSASFSVRIDSVNPTPVIQVLNKQIQNNKIYANQSEALVFNGASSYDYTNSSSDAQKGLIYSWKWDFGDGNQTTIMRGENQNVSHAYPRAGNYVVKLNVTDVVGHYSVAQIMVVVKDTTGPIVSFVIKDEKFASVTTAMENTTLYFDASATTDNVDSLQNLTFRWDFSDGTNATGVNVTHSFAAIKTFTIKLTVTDKSGNSANLTKQIVITSSPRPDLRVTSLVFDPAIFTEGEIGTMKLNVTNVGNANATNIVATFYKMTLTGQKQPLGTSSILNGTVGGQLLPGHYGIITFQWRADTKGNYTIYVEVTASGEISKNDNSYTTSLTVKEAGWKAAAIYGGIFAVIIVVIILVYMRKRLPKVGGKTKGETKPEKGGKEKK
ncbi:MAG: PKD domain-containing protein [Methanomassiliicoccales archaeon]|nr:PKD domain-containing protein [Methanomassiliicoccales archaeon]